MSSPPPVIGLALALGCALFAAACSGAGRASRSSPAGEDPSAGAPTAVGAATAGEAPLTAAECEAFLDRAIERGLVRVRATSGADQVPSAEEVEELRAGVRERELDRCLTQPRRDYECAMAAEDADAASRCASLAE